MGQTIKQSLTGMLGWGGIQALLQDQMISTGGTIGNALLHISCGPFAMGSVDMGAAMYQRGAFRLRIKTPPASVTALARTIAIDGSQNSVAESFQPVGAGSGFSSVPGEIGLELSLVASPFSRHQVVTVGFQRLDSKPGEMNLGPKLFITEPTVFRYARVVYNGPLQANPIAYDLEVIAVP